MKPNKKKIVENCIYNGIEVGWTIAHKHSDSPEPDVIQCRIYEAIMSEFYECFTFDDDE